MNYAMVRRLVGKDWYFNRAAIAAYLAVGIVSLSMLALGGKTAFFAGSVLLITALIAVGIHLVMMTVVYERTNQTLAFVMTLPIDAREYTTAKVVANLAIFGLAWTTLFVGTVAVIAGRGAIPDGLIPYAATILGEIFAAYCLILAVAIVSESTTWTIGAIVLGNLTVQAVMYSVGNVSAVAADLKTDVVVWRGPILAVLGVELAVAVLAIASTFYLQSRKTDFV